MIAPSPVALYDAAVIGCDCRVDEIATEATQARQGAILARNRVIAFCASAMSALGTSNGFKQTHRSATSLHRGVVSDPSYFQYFKDASISHPNTRVSALMVGPEHG
jgi:hypothetical protein